MSVINSCSGIDYTCRDQRETQFVAKLGNITERYRKIIVRVDWAPQTNAKRICNFFVRGIALLF